MIQENKIIADFMGLDYKHSRDGWYRYFQNTAQCTSNPEGFIHAEIQYHKSWDWLMKVVEKIRNEGFDFYVTITNQSTKIERINFDTPSGMETIVEHFVNTVEKEQNRIRVTYSAILEFIQWHEDY